MASGAYYTIAVEVIPNWEENSGQSRRVCPLDGQGEFYPEYRVECNRGALRSAIGSVYLMDVKFTIKPGESIQHLYSYFGWKLNPISREEAEKLIAEGKLPRVACR